MNERNEKISSLMDDYRHTDEDQSVLNAVLEDVNQQYTARRYQMIGEVMRNELPERIQLDFSAEVKTRIEQEASFQQRSSTPAQSEKETSWLWTAFFKPVAGLAVAATVAFVAVTGLQEPDGEVNQTNQVASSNSETKVEQLASMPVINNAVKVSTNRPAQSTQSGTQWKIKRNEPAMQNKLNSYLINHNEYSNSMHGIIPQVRVVGFDAQP